jgi:acetoacetyl-CoA synthetase
MGTPVGEGTLLWESSEVLKQQATLARYMQWLAREKGLPFRDLETLWPWSVSHLEDSWTSISHGIRNELKASKRKGLIVSA